jgi:hypothetical protein
MDRNILKHILVGLVLVTGFLSWYTEFQAIMIPGSSTWALPMLWFGLLFLFICLLAVLMKNTLVVELVVMAVLLISFFFVFS